MGDTMEVTQQQEQGAGKASNVQVDVMRMFVNYKDVECACCKKLIGVKEQETGIIRCRPECLRIGIATSTPEPDGACGQQGAVAEPYARIGGVRIGDRNSAASKTAAAAKIMKRARGRPRKLVALTKESEVLGRNVQQMVLRSLKNQFKRSWL